MSKKIDRALYGPSWTEVLLGAFLSVLLGGALAAAYLITKPVQTVRELPKEPVPGVVYHFEGSRDSSRGRTWQNKLQQLAVGRPITLIEDELNAAAAALQPPAAKKGAEEGKKPMFSAGLANFRIREGEMQVAVPLTLNSFDLGLSTLVQAQGVFERDGEAYVFAPSSLRIGSCQVERLPFVASFVRNRIREAFVAPDAVEAAWGRLSAVRLEGSQLHLTP